MKWISEALIAETKNADMNIQQIADELHFGDQPSFGKFFKKHTGFTLVMFGRFILLCFMSVYLLHFFDRRNE